MKRLVTLAAGVALALPAGAMAFAATDFAGGVNGQQSSIFGFNVDRNAKGHRVASGTIMGNIAYTCDGAPGGSSDGYTSEKRFRIQNGKWSGKQNITESGFDPVLTITGHLDGLKARGTLRLKGTLDTGNPDATCDTGTVHWKATRTAQPG